MASWTSFQSVIQLAIGLNCAFATLAPFLGSVSERDRLLAVEYTTQLDGYEADLRRHVDTASNATDLSEDIASIQYDLDQIKQSSATADVKVAEFLNGSIRLACLSCAAVSLGCLFFSSYADAKDQIDGVSHAFMYLQLAPFIIGIGRIVWIARAHLVNRRCLPGIINRITKIENRIRPLNRNRENQGQNGQFDHMSRMSEPIPGSEARS